MKRTRRVRLPHRDEAPGTLDHTELGVRAIGAIRERSLPDQPAALSQQPLQRAPRLLRTREPRHGLALPLDRVLPRERVGDLAIG